MSEHQKIIEMINHVQEYDTDKLSEIDARVWCLYHGVYYISSDSKGINFGDLKTGTFMGRNVPALKYTRSLDALKTIRPKGWGFAVDATVPEIGVTYEFFKTDGDDRISGDLRKDHKYGEELSQLLAILFVMQHEAKR